MPHVDRVDLCWLEEKNAEFSTQSKEQYTHIQSSAPEDECNNILNMLSNK